MSPKETNDKSHKGKNRKGNNAGLFKSKFKRRNVDTVIITMPPKRMPNRMYVMGTAAGVWVNTNKQPRQDKKSWVQPIKNKIVSNEPDADFQTKTQVNMVCDQRDSSGGNFAKISNGSNAKAFVRILSRNIADTTASRKAWINDHLAPAFNEVARTEFVHPQTFAFTQDDTTNPPSPLSTYLLDEDVVQVIKTIYDEGCIDWAAFAANEQEMAKFFTPAHMENGWKLLLEYTQEHHWILMPVMSKHIHTYIIFYSNW